MIIQCINIVPYNSFCYNLNMVKDTKKTGWIFLFYGLIDAMSNFVSTLIPATNGTPALQKNYMQGWMTFLNDHQTIISFVTVLSFLIPTVLCVSYSTRVLHYGATNKPGKSFDRGFINMPLVFSGYGATGWIFYLLFEIAALLIARRSYDIQFMRIFTTSAMYIVLEALFSFTLSFSIMETLHRRIFLPKFYPEGKLSRFNPKKPSIGMLFVVFYVSIGLFPILFMLTVYTTLTENHSIPLDKKILIILAFLMAFSILILIIFTHFFAEPLLKLKKGTEKIKEGDFNHKVDIVSNDSFGELADTFNDMTISLDEKTKRLIAVQNSVLTGMATMVESRDNSTGGHIRRTSDCVRVFANELEMPQAFLENVVKAAPMHDLGKIAVPDAILQKPGKFTDEEYEKMKAHSAEGARIVENVLSEVDDLEFKKIAINVAHYHHEKWDGSGYPDKLKGEQIPLEARIMALADVFDALVSKRCYKDSFSYDKAFQIIQESLGTHFDPELGNKFIACRNQLEELYNGYN